MWLESLQDIKDRRIERPDHIEDMILCEGNCAMWYHLTRKIRGFVMLAHQQLLLDK